MKIQSLRPSRIKNRINITFDDGSYLPFFIDDVVRLGLKVDQEADYSELKAISTNYLARQYALRQIAISPKTEKILRQKLSKKYRDYNSDKLIESLLSYLDDQKYIDYVCKKFKNKSNREISYRLKLAGISYSPKLDDRQKILNIMKKKKNISISSLVQRGFAYDDIKTLFAKSSEIE